MANYDNVKSNLENLRKAALEMNTAFLGKEEIIDMMFICAIAQEPLLLFGPPGTAKSKLVQHFCDLLGMRSASVISETEKKTAQDKKVSSPFYFQYLLTPFTEPDELFGPVDVNLLKDGRFQRINWQWMLPGATVVFLDEVFRGSSAILNSLLTIINERRFYEAGNSLQAKASVIFGAANQPPSREDLAAFYARFPIRVFSDETKEANLDVLIERGWKLENIEVRKRLLSDKQRENDLVSPVADCEDLIQVQRFFAHHWSPIYLNEDGSERWGNSEILQWTNFKKSPVHRAFVDLAASLRVRRDGGGAARHGTNPYAASWVALDDRKVIKLLKVMLARALWFAPDRKEVKSPDHHDAWQPEICDLLVLKHVWDDSHSAVRDELAEKVRSTIKEAYIKEQDKGDRDGGWYRITNNQNKYPEYKELFGL
ncbi:ATPase RavA [Anaerolineae bacterium]|nr:ATPase RavA [Anaerolineae bacterium]